MDGEGVLRMLTDWHTAIPEQMTGEKRVGGGFTLSVAAVTGAGE